MGQTILRSGELARLTGVGTDLLRHYEHMGILPRPARALNGYRLYPLQIVARVRAVRRSLSLGFSLQELARIFTVKDRGGFPCRSVRALADEKLYRIEQSLVELKALRAQLREIIRDWDCHLAKTPPGQRAGLLESLEKFPALDKSNSRKLKKGFSQS